MKLWIFEHIIMKLFDKEFTQWFHNEIYAPIMKPLPNNWMDEMTEEDWNEMFKRINNDLKKDLFITY